MVKKKDSIKKSQPSQAASVEGLGLSGKGLEDLPPGRFDHIMGNPNLTTNQKKRAILREMGLVSTKKKYGTKAEKEAAAEERKQARLAARAQALRDAGIVFEPGSPRRSYRGLSDEEKKLGQREVSSGRGDMKRTWGQLAMLAVPRTAESLGLRPEGLRRGLASQSSAIRELKELMLEELREDLEKGR